jgi:hypothetical protein
MGSAGLRPIATIRHERAAIPPESVNGRGLGALSFPVLRPGFETRG